MATIKFYLNHPFVKGTTTLRKDEVSIDLMVTVDRANRFRLPTGERINPKYWDKKEKLVKANFRGHLEINQHLSDIKQAALDVWRKNKSASLDELKRLVNVAIKGEGQTATTLQKKTIEPWIESFINESKKKPGTIQVYRSSFTHLKNYATKYGISVTWDIFDLDFYERFTDYLYTIGLNDNTVGKVIKTVKTFISEAFERNLHTNLSFKKKGFKVISAEVDEIYLNEAEIKKYYEADLSKHPHLIESKKKFVFDCYVGLRYSDLLKLNPNQALKTLGGRVLKITTTKTGEDVVIPLHPIAEEIWDSWKGLPPKKSNPDFNAEIKEIARLAGLDEMVQKRNTIKGRVNIEWVPKWQMVKAHTCRRSFATNCYLMGIPIQTIMAVTGHKTEKAFKKYIRITKETHASIMAEYFNSGDNKAVMKKLG